MGEGEGKVKTALRSLCCSYGWSYGVLWRFDPRNSMLLTREETFYEEDQIGQVIGNMLMKVHAVGEGLIGQAALTGDHRWVFAEARENQEADSEILSQFSAGVETIVVIPLEHNGVVQFGATKKIMEKAEFLERTRKLFHEMDSVDEMFQAGSVPSSSSHSETGDINSLFATLFSHESPFNGKFRSINSGFDTNQIQSHSFGNEEDLSPLFANIPNLPKVKGSFTEGPCISSWSGERSVLTSLEPPMRSQPFYETGCELPASSRSKRSFDEFNSSYIPTDNVSNSCLIDDLSQWLAGSPEQCILGPTDSFQNIIGGNYNSSNVLFDSFGVDPGCMLDGNCWDILSNIDTSTNNVFSGYPSKRRGLFSELGIDELLEGAGSTVAKSSFKDPLSTASRRKGAEGHEFLPKSQVGLWIDDSYSINGAVRPSNRPEEPPKPARKRARPGESTRPRPKDRQLIQDRLKELRGIIPNGAKCSIDALLDRTVKHMMFLQNVTKYADKLKQPHEPKLTVHENGSAVLKDKGRRGGEGGTTWAFDMGSQSMVCPIIVEDLSHPGQMMIEMLCEEGELFLEIANIIRGFGLNILKGLMEARHGKIWSHFIVEATRHVTRMDVFWSLVQLLQQTGPTSGQPDLSNRLNHIANDPVLPCKSYNPSLLPLPMR